LPLPGIKPRSLGRPVGSQTLYSLSYPGSWKRHNNRVKKMERVRGEHDCQTVCLSMYSVTENIYYSQLSSVEILLQPEPVSHRIIQGKDCVFSPSVLSSCVLPLPPTCLVLTVSEARSYFASAIVLSIKYKDLN
jgi:hypothetical protein